MPVKKRIPIEKDLFIEPRSPSEKPRLVAGHCTKCGETFIPKQNLCPNCCTPTVQDAAVGPKGKLYSFTNVNSAGPAQYEYRGPVPYGVGLIEFPEGLRIYAPLTEWDPAKLKIGMTVEMVLEPLFTDQEGNDVIAYKFKPVKG